MRGGHGPELLLGLGQRDIQHGFATAGAGQQKLQRQRGLAGTGHAFYQKQPAPGEAACQDVVQPFDAGGRRIPRLPCFRGVLALFMRASWHTMWAGRLDWNANSAVRIGAKSAAKTPLLTRYRRLYITIWF